MIMEEIIGIIVEIRRGAIIVIVKHFNVYF